jgi:hypothetical protein
MEVLGRGEWMETWWATSGVGEMGLSAVEEWKR